MNQPPQVAKMWPPLQVEMWRPQDEATNVQDWERAARRVAEGLEAAGMLPGWRPGGAGEAARPGGEVPFMIRVSQDTAFLEQMKGALQAEIIGRRGSVTVSPQRAFVIDLKVDVIRWGSRAVVEPHVPRREAVWSATITSGTSVLVAFRAPFYIHESDIPLYAQVVTPGEAMARAARPLRYVVR